MSSQTYKPGDLSLLFAPKSSESSSSAALESVVQAFNKPLTQPTAAPPSNRKRRRSESLEEPPAKKTTDDANVSAAEAPKSEAVEAAKVEAEREARTLFVGNVPVGKKTQAKVKRLFAQQVGQVESVRLRSVPIGGAAIPSNSGFKVMRKVSVNKGSFSKAVEQPTCVAYVVFAAVASLEKALAREESFTLLGNTLRVDRAASSKKDRLFERRRTVFIGNLPFVATENMVMEYFSQHLNCRVTSVRLIRDKASNMGKGIGYVLLPSEELLEPALKLNGEEFQGRQIRVSRCERAKAEKQKPGKMRKFQGRQSHRKAAKIGRVKKPGKAAGSKVSKRKQRLKKVKKLEKKVRKQERKDNA